MMTHPYTNNYMCLEAIKGLNLEFFDEIYFVFLAVHKSQYDFLKGFNASLNEMGILHKTQLVFLESETRSQSETVYEAIVQKDIKGYVFIKDSDGYFNCTLEDELNIVAYEKLDNIQFINPMSKSYVELDDNGYLTNIVEKQVVSSNFCVGGYGFESHNDFKNYYLEVNRFNQEAYISDVIFLMLLKNTKFKSILTSKFQDWGTLDEWNKYKRKFKCIFADIDGTLISNSSNLFAPYTGSGSIIAENVNSLNELHANGFAYIVLTTSRNESVRQQTIKELEEHGILYDQLIMGLPHAQRVLINDFSISNPYPSGVAINLPRDSNSLSEYLE
jgi:hypothetical protein